MRFFSVAFILIILCPAHFLVGQEPHHELNVHLAQSNNDSKYSFVRAKFEPGEVADPWCVKFFDSQGAEVPYFVWDSITWEVAREGRADWGNRYALLNHHPGSAPEAMAMRAHRLQAAEDQLPELGQFLSQQDAAAKQMGSTLCAALYLVRHRVAPLGKDKLKMHIYSTRQVEPRQRKISAGLAGAPLRAAAGDLMLKDLPSEIAVHWRGKEIFRYAGFELGDKSLGEKSLPIHAASHATTAKPFSVDILEGIITQVRIQSRTSGRAGSDMNWQCTYWLFPDGAYAALKGFSFDNAEGYLGGGLSMARLQTPAQPRQLHEPSWSKPWSLYQTDDSAFVAIHQFTDTPLTVGYANNPFNVSTPGSFRVAFHQDAKKATSPIELLWTYNLTDKRIYRLFHPHLDNDGSYDLAEITDVRETLSTGKLTNVPRNVTKKDGTLVWPRERVSALEEALRFVKWQSQKDWLYRQYLVGCGQDETGADDSIRQILGAAAGWVDRPHSQQQLADLVVKYSLRKSASPEANGSQHFWLSLPAALEAGDVDQVAKILAGGDPARIAADAIDTIEKHKEAGGDPIQGMTKGGGEGWHNNPAYFAVNVPESLRYIEHFQLYSLTTRSEAEYRAALIAWADYSLETLGGLPFDVEKLRTSLRTLWPNRVVMLVPLMLRAYDETDDKKYLDVARLVFDEILFSQMEKNPHGYFWAWGASPEKAELFDTNYNLAAYDRGITDYWSEGRVDEIGRERAAQFAAAQARYLVFSGQLLDTLETDSMTAIQTQFPGMIPFAVANAPVLLYDDFAFYRGILGDSMKWAAIDDEATVEVREGRRNYYSMKIGTRGLVFWAYGIGRDAPSASPTAQQMRDNWLKTMNSDHGLLDRKNEIKE